MFFKRLVLPLLFLVLVPLTASAGEAPALDGVFSRVPGQQYRFDGKAVEIIEFMSFYCGTCYAFEESIPVIRGNFPKRTKWRIVPIYWGEGSPKPGEAYLLAVEDGKGEQMKKALFRARFVEKKDIGDIEVIESIAADIGLGFDFSRRLRTGEKAEEAQKALEMARTYRVDETPTLIIAGNIKTNPHAFNHDTEAFGDNVIVILKSMLE